MGVVHLLRPIYGGGPFTEAHAEVVHLLRLIYGGEPFTEAHLRGWAIY